MLQVRAVFWTLSCSIDYNANTPSSIGWSKELYSALTFDKQEDIVLFGTPEFTKWHELWQMRLGRQQESKSSSKQLMQNSNPSIIPRNHRVEDALEAAVKQEDYSVMERLLDVISSPYAYSPEQDDYSTLSPESNRPYRTFCGT